MTPIEIPKPESRWEAELSLQLRTMKLPAACREYRFNEKRKWRFDFAWPDLLLAVEVEGITHDHGRHQRKSGFEADLEKYDVAMREGWTVYRCSPAMVKAGRAVETIAIMLERSRQLSEAAPPPEIANGQARWSNRDLT